MHKARRITRRTPLLGDDLRDDFNVLLCIYAMKYEGVANGEEFVMAGYFIPQADGSYVTNVEFVPEEGAGRFAGDTGFADELRAIPGGYVIEGTINLVTPHETD